MAGVARATWAETWRRLFKLTNKKDPLCASVTVGATAVLLEAGTGDETRPDRGCLIIFNNSSSIIYVGGSGVTTNNGLPVLPNDYFVWESEDDLYAIAATAGNDVRIIETA